MGEGAAPVYGVHAGLAALMGMILWAMLPRGVVAERRPLPRLSDHLVLYTTPRLFAPALGHGIYAFLFLALVTYLPTALGALWLAAVLPLAGIAGSLATGPLARLIAPAHLVSGGFLAMAAVFAAALALPGFAAPLSVLAMLVSGVVAGGGFAAVPWLNEADADRALANGALGAAGQYRHLFRARRSGGAWCRGEPAHGHRRGRDRGHPPPQSPTAPPSLWMFAERSAFSVGDSACAPYVLAGG